MTPSKSRGYRLYWKIWVILLIVTLVMIFIDRPTAQALQGDDTMLSPGVLVLVLVCAMLLKAVLIATYFMHLKFERPLMGIAVLLGLLINGAILFALLYPDAVRILGMQSG